jgi:hypothetical protein
MYSWEKVSDLVLWRWAGPVVAAAKVQLNARGLGVSAALPRRLALHRLDGRPRAQARASPCRHSQQVHSDPAAHRARTCCADAQSHRGSPRGGAHQAPTAGSKARTTQVRLGRPIAASQPRAGAVAGSVPSGATPAKGGEHAVDRPLAVGAGDPRSLVDQPLSMRREHPSRVIPRIAVMPFSEDLIRPSTGVSGSSIARSTRSKTPARRSSPTALSHPRHGNRERSEQAAANQRRHRKSCWPTRRSGSSLGPTDSPQRLWPGKPAPIAIGSWLCFAISKGQGGFAGQASDGPRAGTRSPTSTGSRSERQN